ncbi:MAG: helicase C-terminal domain-containing protein [Dehalococcoidia bacterium]|nr:helicase C-terminal domain-containing protein [Dehalococcoidia bacterium]
MVQEGTTLRILLTPEERTQLAQGQDLVLDEELVTAAIAETINITAAKQVLADNVQDPIFPPPAQPDVMGQIRCHRCRRALTHPDSRTRGLGPICAAKWIWEQPFTVDEKLAKLRALRDQVRETGEISESDLTELIERLQVGQDRGEVDPYQETSHALVDTDNDDQESDAPARPSRRLPTHDPELDMAAVERIFRETFATKMPGYEAREPQVQLAREITRALATGAHLVSEAGTGTGKSLAYLVPAVHWAQQEGQSVLVSTGTIALQEQLVQKDIPFLQRTLDKPFSAALIKGKGNYLCQLRHDEARKDEQLRADPEFQQVDDWATQTATGDKSDLPFVPADQVWRRLNVDESCLRHKCPVFDSCHLYRARERAKTAQILVCNHHLLMVDLQFGMLPEYGALVLDEAHHLEEIASESFGVEVSRFRIPVLMRDIERMEHPDLPAAQLHTIRLCNSRLMAHFARAEVAGKPVDKATLSQIAGEEQYLKLARDLIAELKLLVDELAKLDWSWADDRTKARCDALMLRAANLAGELGALFNPIEESAALHVAWVEVDRSRDEPRVTLHLNPIDVGPIFKDLLWDPVHSVTCTSATISSGGKFSYFKRLTGLDRVDPQHREVLELQVDSPFSFQEQALLYVPRGLPEPREEQRWTQAVIGATRDVLQACGGRAFCLYTSYKQLRAVHEVLAPELEATGYVVFRQGDMQRSQLIEAFKQTHTEGRSPVLFATGTFWEGIDIQGSALSCLILDKLPFAMPTDPLSVAKAEAVRRQGYEPFMHLTVPQAVIKMKQGFGRLIRTRTDRGLVAILDPRIRTKGYGRQFLRSLPPAREIYHLGDVPGFLQGG